MKNESFNFEEHSVKKSNVDDKIKRLILIHMLLTKMNLQPLVHHEEWMRDGWWVDRKCSPLDSNSLANL
jgi:hypothetical protein